MKTVSVMYTFQGHYSVYNTPPFDCFKNHFLAGLSY